MYFSIIFLTNSTKVGKLELVPVQFFSYNLVSLSEGRDQRFDQQATGTEILWEFRRQIGDWR